ncbi:MAG: OmpA family protein [Verrucomicrobiaceae bacterium]|nr:OmpA family protein [Verrucomicrobiaceae bacterium]
MNLHLLLSCFLISAVTSMAQGTVRTPEEIDKMLHPEKQAPSSTGGLKTRGKTRGSSGAAAAPVTLTTTKRAAVISAESQRILTRGGIRGKVEIKANPAAAADTAPTSSSTYSSSPPAMAEVQVYEQTRTAFSNILFKLGGTEFADESSRQQVANIAIALKAHPTETFVIEGHTCDLGDDHKNQTLSLDRAQAVANHLIRAGVKPEQLVVLGFGETEQLARPFLGDSPAQAEAVRAPNRRVGVARVAE